MWCLLSRCHDLARENRSGAAPLLDKLHVSVEKAFWDFNFAPTKLRRNIAILGLLHKRVLGLCHPSFDKLLPWYSQHFSSPRAVGHNKQLYGHWLEVTQHRTLFRNSIFGMIDIYNNLPQYVVDAQSVSAFQGLLTKMAKARCQRNDVDWESSFARRAGPDLDGSIIQADVGDDLPVLD